MGPTEGPDTERRRTLSGPVRGDDGPGSSTAKGALTSRWPPVESAGQRWTLPGRHSRPIATRAGRRRGYRRRRPRQTNQTNGATRSPPNGTPPVTSRAQATARTPKTTTPRRQNRAMSGVHSSVEHHRGCLWPRGLSSLAMPISGVPCGGSSASPPRRRSGTPRQDGSVRFGIVGRYPLRACGGPRQPWRPGAFVGVNRHGRHPPTVGEPRPG